MKKRKTLLTVALFAAIALMAVGFAAVSARNLAINGTASATGDAKNFLVAYDTTEEPVTVDPAHGSITANYSSDSRYFLTNADNETVGPFMAELTVEGLTTKDDEASATFVIKNYSADMNAVIDPSDIKVTVTDSADEGEISYAGSTDYFDVSAALEGTDAITLGPGETTTITANVKLKTTLIDVKKVDITVMFKAKPEEIK